MGLNIVETQNVDKFSKDPEVISDREFEAMQLAEQGQLDKAIELQTHLIENHSGNCASLYNNRFV